MARALSERLTITGTLQAKTPLHIGGLPDSTEVDMPLARNGQGELYVPGTSLAGIFRAWMERHFNNVTALDEFFGSQQPTKKNKPKGAASRLLIEDAKVTLPADLPEELWDSVSIDRRWGTVADGKKFDRTVLPKGSRLDFCLQVDLPKDIELANTMRAMLGYLMKALQAGQVALGAASTRGLGQIELISPQLLEVDWSQKDSLLSWLGDELEAKKLDCKTLIEAIPTLVCRRPSILHITIDWTPVGPLMVKASHDGIAVDTLPMISGVDDKKIALVLPGSSLKGALRGQAERIVRTVLGHTQLSKEWLKQVQVPLIDYVFGAAKKAYKKKELKDSKDARPSVPGRGCISVYTCYAKNAQCTTEQWQQIETAKPLVGNKNHLYDAFKSAKFRQSPYFEQGYHLAVDRWTGGAAEGFLYSAIEPFEVEWEPIHLTLDLGKEEKEDSDRLPSELKAPALALLLLLLRDLSEQRLPIGFGVNRGYGVLAVKKVTFQWEEMSEIDNKHWLDGVSLENPFSLNNLSGQEIKKLQSDWQVWINAQKKSKTLSAEALT